MIRRFVFWVFRKTVYMLGKAVYFDQLYNYFVGGTVLRVGYDVFFKIIDQGIIGMLGPVGLVRFVDKFSYYVISLQTGYIYHYLLFMVFGLVFVLFTVIGYM